MASPKVSENKKNILHGHYLSLPEIKVLQYTFELEHKMLNRTDICKLHNLDAVSVFFGQFQNVWNRKKPVS